MTVRGARTHRHLTLGLWIGTPPSVTDELTDVDEEIELLARWRDGDDAAGHQLLERYFGLVAAFFRYRLDTVDDAAADLIAETFLRAVDGRARLTADMNFRGFLMGIARVVLHKHYRELRAPRDRTH